MQGLAAAFLAAYFAFPVWAQKAGNGKAGGSVFSQYCAFCHGSEATGAEGPNLILSPVVRHDKSGELIAPVIHNGRPEKGMPPVSLTPEQTADVVAFLHERIDEYDRRSAGKPSAGYTLKRLDTGDAQQGQAFFRARCAQCHSVTGDLRAIASKYPPVELQTRMLYPPDVPETAEIRTSDGKVAGEGTVLYQDPFTIAIWDRDGSYKSWDPQDVKISLVDPLHAHRELLDEYTESDVHNVFAYLETLR